MNIIIKEISERLLQYTNSSNYYRGLTPNITICERIITAEIVNDLHIKVGRVTDLPMIGSISVVTGAFDFTIRFPDVVDLHVEMEFDVKQCIDLYRSEVDILTRMQYIIYNSIPKYEWSWIDNRVEMLIKSSKVLRYRITDYFEECIKHKTATEPDVLYMRIALERPDGRICSRTISG